MIEEIDDHVNKMYHGSYHPRLKTIKPSGKHKVIYGTTRRGLAIFFSLKKARWKNIKRVGDEWHIHGLSEKDLSSPGYVYYLDPEDFDDSEGWQYYCHEEVSPLSVEKIDNVGRELRRLGFVID